MNAVLAKAEQLARGEVGYREGPRNNETKYGVWFGTNFVAWCAIFCSWLSFHSGLTYLGKPWRFASTISAREHAKRNRRWVSNPLVGTIAMMAHTSTTGHVGYVIALLRKNGVLYVVTIEGNTNDQGAREGNGVWIRTRAASSWDGYIVLDQTNEVDVPTNPEEEEMPRHFYKIRDENDISKPHPTKGDAIYVTDEVWSKFISGDAWAHEKGMGWWTSEEEAKVELIPESLHNWLIATQESAMLVAISQQIKEALASGSDGGPGTITNETIDKIVSGVLDAQYNRMKE